MHVALRGSCESVGDDAVCETRLLAAASNIDVVDQKLPLQREAGFVIGGFVMRLDKFTLFTVHGRGGSGR